MMGISINFSIDNLRLYSYARSVYVRRVLGMQQMPFVKMRYFRWKYSQS